MPQSVSLLPIILLVVVAVIAIAVVVSLRSKRKNQQDFSNYNNPQFNYKPQNPLHINQSYCKACGKKIVGAGVFCQSCGAEVDRED